jgi:hypothetical protein
MSPLDQHRRELSSRLRDLRGLFSGQEASSYVGLFDEFLRQQEFGLALEALCDFLVEPNGPGITETDINRIEALHLLMQVEDNCVSALRRRYLRRMDSLK